MRVPRDSRAPTMTSTKPVSLTLELDLRAWVQRHGVAVWLDPHNHYGEFVAWLTQEREAGRVPYGVRTFQGSHLDLFLSLEDLGSGLAKPSLVIHLPGFTEEHVRASPVLELYAVGARYRKGIETLVREAAAGKVLPEQIDNFLGDGVPTLARADAWLAELLNDDTRGLAGQLRAMRPTAVLDDLLDGGSLSRRLASTRGQGPDADRVAIRDQLAAWTGRPHNWGKKDEEESSDEVVFGAVSWALCVEYVDDLTRAPVSPLLAAAHKAPVAVVDHCRAVASWARGRPAFYSFTADATENLLDDERRAAQAEDLGQIDTFRFEEAKVFEAALEALGAERYAEAGQWAARRVDGASFWLGQDVNRYSAWQIIAACAALGKGVGTAGGKLDAQSLEGAILRYTEVGSSVDRAHRELVQIDRRLLLPNLPHFGRLRSCADALYRVWHAWADAWTGDFCRLCSAEGFLPPSSLQQRNLFEEVVRPRAQESGTTAYFTMDALRYEMAQELYHELEGTTATRVELDARLAELPTVTAVGMNVLAPVVHNGQLHPKVIANGQVAGFASGAFRVHNPETRRRAMFDRVGGEGCRPLGLDEVLRTPADKLRNMAAQTRLFVVHSIEIDAAGENDAGPSVFPLALSRIRSAWQLLRDAGVRRFVITADHGFLLLDDKAASVQGRGRLIDPKRRYVFTTSTADEPGEVRVLAAELGYADVPGSFCFPDSTAVYDRGEKRDSFVHGGNSLQERVIPVLTLTHKVARGGNHRAYTVDAWAGDAVLGMHRLHGRVELVSQLELGFGGRAEVPLTLQVAAAGVQVELAQALGGGRLAGGVLVAAVGEEFELFFRLVATEDTRCQVEVVGADPTAVVAAFTLKTLFEVAAPTGRTSEKPAPSQGAVDHDHWFLALPDGVRQVFQHLAEHGVITETELSDRLSPRGARRFARKFEDHCAKVPFAVRVDNSGNEKRYVREGTTWQL